MRLLENKSVNSMGRRRTVVDVAARSRFSNFRWLLLFSALLIHVEADWIDPDTPEDVKTATRYSTRLAPLPPSQAPTIKPTKKPRKHKKTAAPTTAGTPTSSPTEYPTFSPDKVYELVFSDEFNTPSRTFEDGSDPRWTALDKNDYTNGAFHYYTPNNVETRNGSLVITSEAADTEIIGFDDVKLKNVRDTKHFRSGMLQSWNKFCFTGGIIEAEATLPGKSTVGGLWPAFWILGNLARHTYVAGSEHIWPWSSSVCTKKSGYAQKISGCDSVEHYGMKPRLGRGAPEVDIFEVQPGNIKANTGNFLKTPVGQPFMSSSFQVAPGRPSSRPGPGEWPGPGQWYEGIRGGRNTSLNILFYGDYNHFLADVNPLQEDYWSDAISFNRQLDEDYFQNPHVYRLEWGVPTNHSDGYLHWFLDGELVFALNGTGVRKADLGTEISTEPSYIIFNTAISKQWGFPIQCPTNCPCKKYDCHSDEWALRCGFSEGFCDMMTSEDKPEYKINWVRVYQDPDNPAEKVGCSTPERPTRKWIEAHEGMYKTKNDVHPLKGIQRGRGTCTPAVVGSSRDSCGGPKHGRCTSGRECECLKGFTGPHCLVPEGSDPILYDRPDKITDVGFIPPNVAPKFLFFALAGLVALLFLALQLRRRFDGYSPIPECLVKTNNPTIAYQPINGMQYRYE